MKFEAEVKELPERFVACIRHVGPYPEIGKAIEKIFQWAGPKGLIQFPKTDVLAVYHDNPEETAEAELRSDACITVPEDTAADGEVKTMTCRPCGARSVGVRGGVGQAGRRVDAREWSLIGHRTPLL